MNAISAIAKMQKLMRLKHYSLKTEETYCGWARRYDKTVPTEGGEKTL